MKKEYDFRGGKRGAIVKASKGKVRITIRLDKEIVEWFKKKVDEAGGGNYQTLINESLVAYIQNEEQPLETVLRRVIREELAHDKKEDAA